MDFESANGCHIDDTLAGNNECATNVNALTMESNDFYFGKNPTEDFHPDINTEQSVRSNGDGDKFSSNDAIDEEHDDFGPETDVDATDDNAISPISPSVRIFIFFILSSIAIYIESATKITGL